MPPPDPPGRSEGEDDIPSVGSVLDFGEAGAYTLEARLGQGGMGEVYRARQVGAKGFSQHVAIKRLRAGSRPWVARSFVDEARVLSRLHHENIARIYAFHEMKGSDYLVMEYIEGQSLYALLELARRRGYRFPEPVACELMAQVADALSCAHHATDEAGKPLQIIHRDVSPSNILITELGRAVLVDFGVAFHNMEGRSATRSGFIKGKTPYFSPEQVKELPLDGRSDLFPVGTILVEMLTGRAPFGSTRSWGTLVRIGAVTPEYVAALLPGVSPPLRAICQKLLAREPEQRFADGADVRQALRQHARLHDAPPAVQRAVAELRALPDVQPPPVLPELPPLRLVKRSRRRVQLLGALAFACLFASWYLVRRYIPVSAAPPPLQGPGHTVVSSAPLVGKPNGKDAAKVAAAPPSAPAPREHSAPPAILPDKKARTPSAVTAPPPAGMHTSVDSDESRSKLEADYVKAYGEALSPPHAVAALFATGNSQITQFARVSARRLKANGVDVYSEVWKDDDSGMVAVVVDLTNPDDAPSWEPNEGRVVSDEHPSIARPVALRAMPRVILPGQRGRVVLVFNRSVVEEKAMVEILRGSRPEFGMEVSSQELESRWSLWPF